MSNELVQARRRDVDAVGVTLAVSALVNVAEAVGVHETVLERHLDCVHVHVVYSQWDRFLFVPRMQWKWTRLAFEWKFGLGLLHRPGIDRALSSLVLGEGPGG